MPTVLPNEVRRLAEMEKHAIQAAIAHAKGNLSQAARSLGISRSTLYVKLSAMRDRADSQHKPR
ncbi:helix-turn-helix domain-containing protein [Aquitalea magnusonii]|uniref:helix-turn-helix domain-containing protein n=1 Tax=Aquitalea magnusonii TaxID=332411 RepID=UPI001958F67E|nr:helix-turn-helix domain-containing protein [Aquitalea magnusonii]